MNQNYENANVSVAGVLAKMNKVNTFEEDYYENIPYEDREDVKQLLWKLAVWGNADAAYELYNLYINGYFGEITDEESTKYLRKAANLGHPNALFVLGMSLMSQPSTIDMFNYAAKAIEESARKGCVLAEGVMSVLVADGKTAKRWRKKAIKHGCPSEGIEFIENVLFVPLLMFGHPSSIRG